MDKLPTPILTRIVSETDYDTALTLCHTSQRLSQVIRSPNNDTAIFRNIAHNTFPWLHPAVGQTWRDLAYDVENVGPESDAEIWKETAQWTLADPDTDLGLTIFTEHHAAETISKDHVTRHMNEKVTRDAETWGSALVEVDGVVVDMKSGEAWRKESKEDKSRDPKITKQGGKWFVNNLEIPVTEGFIPTIHTHNGQTFIFETTVDVTCPDTAMSNLHVIDWSCDRYIFLLSLVHEAGVYPVPYLSNTFLWLFYEHFVVKFNVDAITWDEKARKYTSKIYYISQSGLPVSIREGGFRVDVLWGRFVKISDFFLDLETLMWFRVKDGHVHGMLHKSHHLWDYSEEVLKSIVETVGGSGEKVDISGCLKVKKKKKKSKKKGGKEMDEVIGGIENMDVNKDLPAELQID